MSTVVTQNFEDKATGKSVDAAHVTDGTAKAMLRYDQATATVLQSLNVSSVTDLAVGRPQPNWSTSFADTSYCITCSPGASSGISHARGGHKTAVENDAAVLVGSVIFNTHTDGYSAGDNIANDWPLHCTALGDLA